MGIVYELAFNLRRVTFFSARRRVKEKNRFECDEFK